VAALLSLAVAGLSAYAEPPTGALKRIHDTGTIKIGYREDALPFSFVGTDGEPTGYSVELCTRVANAIKGQLKLPSLKTTWVPVTAETRIDAVDHGKVDIECGMTTVTMGRQEKVDFSYLVFADGGNMLVRQDSKATRLADLNGKKVAVQSATTTEQLVRDGLAQRRIQVEVVPVSHAREGLTLLEDGKVDGYAGDRTALLGLALKARDISKLRLIDEDFSYEPYAIMLPRNDADLRLAVNRELTRLYRSGEIADILNDWFGAFGQSGVLLSSMFYLNAIPE
jgi:polar amino acid transport system substrate-binding protein/glutamate/aspartate transport system substrate-binding protein